MVVYYVNENSYAYIHTYIRIYQLDTKGVESSFIHVIISKMAMGFICLNKLATEYTSMKTKYNQATYSFCSRNLVGL